MAVRGQSARGATTGRCRLCGNTPPIKNSHLLPKFGYRRYIADPKRGGSFVDLHAQREHSRQLTRGWFCAGCGGKFAETYAANVLSQLDQNRSNLRYSKGLLRFATSLSWRACLHELDAGKPQPSNRAILRPALKKWRSYLLGKSLSVGQFTQHAFVFAPSDYPWEQRMGCEIAYAHHLVVSQIGPLVCFGLLGKKGLDRRDAKVLSQSEWTDAGGVLPVISEFQINDLLTDEMAQALNHVTSWCIDKIKRLAAPRS